MCSHRPEGRDAASDCEAAVTRLREGMIERGGNIRLEMDAERPA